MIRNPAGAASPKLLVLVAIAAVAAAAAFLPVHQWVLALVEWIRGAGATGAAVFAIAYVAATVMLVPGSLLTAGAGFAYGPVLGTLLVSPVSVVAATLSFLLGRSIARDWVAGRVRGDPRFARIDRAVGANGFKIVALLRLSPIFPFNLLNYSLGLTRVRLRDYVLASWLGMLPGTLLYVYLGSLVTNASELVSGSSTEGGGYRQALYFGGLLATIAVTVVITRVARTALDDVITQSEPPAAATGQEKS